MKPAAKTTIPRKTRISGRVKTMMVAAWKDGTFTLFAVLLAVAGCWLLMQERNIAEIDNQTSSLEKRIATARNQKPEQSTGAVKKPRPDANAGDAAFDWKRILSELSGQGDGSELTRLRKRLKNMSAAEISNAFDEIERMDMLPEATFRLENVFLPALIEMDPVAALTKFAGAANSGIAGPSERDFLARALGVWARKEPANAGAWMDRMLSNGMFDNKSLAGASPTRIRFETEMVEALSHSDLAAAKQRLSALTEDAAQAVLVRTYPSADRQEQDAVFAKLARETLSPSRSIAVFSCEASRLSKDYADVTAYLDRISASAAEREACIGEAAKTRLGNISFDRAVTLEEVEAMRDWAGANRADVDEVTGKALGHATGGNRMTFDDASAIVLHYYEISGDDHIIRAFLTGNARSFGDQSRALAEKIADPAQRAAILERIW